MDTNKLMDQLIELANSTGVDDFDGLSPAEMDKLIYSPFSDESPIQFNSKLEKHDLADCPIYQICREVLSAVSVENGLKLTATGNLPPKMVADIYAKKYLPDEDIENGIVKMRNEKDWIAIHSVKIALQVGGIVRKYKGRLMLTKKGKQLFPADSGTELFFCFFEAFSTKFSWAYNDGHYNDQVGQVGGFYLLYLVNKYGDEPRLQEFYISRYLKAFPMFKDEAPESGEIDYKRNEYAAGLRFFKRFAHWFGFVDIQVENEKSYFDRKIIIKKTEFLSRLITEGPSGK